METMQQQTRIELPVQVFRKALSTCKKVMGRKCPLPIIEHALVHKDGDDLVITATNLSDTVFLTIQENYEGTFEQQLIPIKWVGEIAGRLDTKKPVILRWVPGVDYVCLYVEQAGIINFSQRHTITFDVVEFPIVEPENMHRSIRKKVFIAALPNTDQLRKGLEFVSTDSDEPIMCSINLTHREMWATNAHIAIWEPLIQACDANDIGEAAFPWPAQDDKKYEALIPSRIKAFMPELKGAVLVYVWESLDNGQLSATHAEMIGNGIRIILRIPDGKYPNIHAVLPTRYTQPEKQFTFTANREELLQAVSQLATVNAETARIRFCLSVSSLDMQAEDIDINTEASMSVPIQNGNTHEDVGGDGFTFFLNGNYMATCLRNSEGESVTITYMSANRALTINKNMICMPCM